MTFPTLPVEAVAADVAAALEHRGAAVVVAPPGSGKTTILPLRLLDAPWLEGRSVVVLEPRRLATRAAARRMAQLLGEEVGERVGYTTRDDRRVGPTTRVEVVTEGVLIRRLQRHPELPGVGVVIFDELHERNLETDLGLALCLDVRRGLRPDLRLLAMSATLDAEPVAQLLGDGEAVPVITADARPHPVEVRWVPPPRTTRLEDHAAAVIRRAVAVDQGDVLCFLPGMGEMRRVAALLEDPPLPAEVHLLHGSLPLAEQDAALAPAPPGGRKVVLATDIAESSLTVEGVRVVVDSGLARAPRFDPRTGMTRLRTIPVSRASAEQRAGRAGREAPGVAYRLWSKLEHGARRRNIDPEITQVDLAGLLLELAAWGVDDPRRLPFLDPPPPRAVEEGRRLLEVLGALDGEGRLTPLGRRMAELPLHPRLARMVASAGEVGWLACLLAALVSERDPLRGPPDELPVGLEVRLRLLTGELSRHPAASPASVERVRRIAEDIARRAGVSPGTARWEQAGRVLALGFPDRLAVRRGSPGRFQLRTGTTAWLPERDPLATESFLVAVDTDGKRRDARIRLAAPLDPEEVASAFRHEVDETVELVWDGDRLLERRERRLGGMVLDRSERRPQPGPAVTAALAERLRREGIERLGWSEAARRLRERVRWLHRRGGERWPDWSEEALAASVEEWLFPEAGEVTGWDDLQRLDLERLLRRRLGPLVAELDRLAPSHLQLSSGRRVAVDYSGEVPAVAVRVQELFGVEETPQVGGVPVVLHLLSPAGRPVQITRDLAGFWKGSWHQVRKEMAGRYPKHAWPEDPTSQ